MLGLEDVPESFIGVLQGKGQSSACSGRRLPTCRRQRAATPAPTGIGVCPLQPLVRWTSQQVWLVAGIGDAS